MTKRADKVRKTDEEWRRQLTPEEYQITRAKGTERAFTGEYWDTKEEGVYRCRCCGEPLFASDTKYDSGSGWPSFYAPVAEDAVETKADNSLFMRRTEVLCARCDAHLGHAFPDGPRPTGVRYCINSAALRLEADSAHAEGAGRDEPWRLYYEELRRRAEPILAQPLDRDDDLARAAHEAYRTLSDRLTAREAWEDDAVLALGRGLNAVAKAWIDAGHHELERLEAALEAHWAEWRERRPTP